MNKPGETLHTLAVRLDGQERLMDERDRLYAERHAASQDAIQAALLAVKDQTAASFAASEKAIVKAEAAQTAYNEQHNDLVRKMDTQYSYMMPRTEADGRFAAHAEKFDELRRDINALRESRSESGGKAAGASTLWGYVIGAIGAIAALVAILTR